MYLLDTNICIYLMSNKKGFSDTVRERFRMFNSKDIRISSITSAELYYGAAKSIMPLASKQKVDIFLAPFEIIEFGEDDSVEYGKLKGALEQKGTPIGILDNMIAVQALTRSLTLVTNNEKEFKRIPNLKLENWVEQ
jgi:tRNA(fMet)-specific endonuclease VapC